MACVIPALSPFQPRSAHPQPNGPGFAFWLQGSIKPEQRYSLLCSLDYCSLNHCMIQSAREGGLVKCVSWHQDALNVPVLTCLPQLRVPSWRGIWCLLYDSEEECMAWFSEVLLRSQIPFSFPVGLLVLAFHASPWEQFIMNKHQGNGRKVLSISASFPICRLVGIAAKSSIAPSPLIFQGHPRVLWSTLTTQKNVGREGRNVQESTPHFTALDHWVPTSPQPRAMPSQAASKRVSMRDKTCWSPALLSDWHTSEAASRLHWLPIVPRGWLTTAALFLLLLILWLLSALKTLSLHASKGWMLLASLPIRLAGFPRGWQGILCSQQELQLSDTIY